MRAPSAAWVFIFSYSSGVKRPGLRSTASSTAILPRSCMGAALMRREQKPSGSSISGSARSSSVSRRTPSLVRRMWPPVELSRLSTMAAMPRISLSCMRLSFLVAAATSRSRSLL